MAQIDAKLKGAINSLPRTAGVYLFYENPLNPRPSSLNPIYIGKAINLRDRVKNHFAQPSYRDNLFIEKVSRVDFINTDSEIEALVLEAQLIKKHLPKYNVIWKDGKNYFYVAFEKNAQGVPFVYITHQPRKVLSIKYKVSGIQNTKYLIPNTHHIGPFVEGQALKKTVKYLRRVFPFYTATRHPNNRCTWCHLDLCPGPNPNLAEYKKNLKKLTLILQGKRKTVLYALRKEMTEFSEKNKFEEAGKVRDKIQALKQIMAHTSVIARSDRAITDWNTTQKIVQKMLGMRQNISKIECYDISNIQGKNAVGSMVVFVDGTPDKSQYKKFRIRMKNEPNDIAMLKEVLTRRLSHPEWGYPEVMLIDGGIAQLNVAINSKSQITNYKQYPNAKKIKIISIAKGKQELLIEGKHKLPLKSLPQEIYNLVKHLDDEAHRFSITYHKNLRKRTLLDS